MASTSIRAAFFCALALATMAAPASAQTTHNFLYSFNVSGGDPQVGGVDRDGYVYVYKENLNTVSKYDAEGHPVDFSALETNVIDGAGTGDCPNTPSDCDQVPGNGFFGTYGSSGGKLAVDQSGGPADGYIYVANNYDADIFRPGRIQVFDSTGVFRGVLDFESTFPRRVVGGGQTVGVSVAGNGHVFVDYCCFTEFDQFAPVDGNPAHDAFVGQIRRPGWNFAVGGTNYSYGRPNDPWEKYSNAEFLSQAGSSSSVDFSPDPGPFGASNSAYDSASVDPANDDVYLHDFGSIQQWDENNHKIGPDFGSPEAGAVLGIGFDHSGGPTDGYLYMRGTGQSIAVFSPPVIIPDVTYGPITPDHHGASVTGTIGLDGGPQVSDCHVEYGFDQSYGNTAPCNQATPFSSDTAVDADLTGIPVESNYHYRFVATNSNGTTYGADRVVRTAAVLELRTDPATGVDPTHATLNGSLNADGLETTYHFAYGITSNYDSSTPEQNGGAGTAQAPVSGSQLIGLQPGRTYHYAIVATNSLGTTTGPDRTFTTSRAPAVSGVDATDVAETSADLRARIDPFGYDTTYHFEYGPTPSYGASVPIPDESVGEGVTEQSVTAHLSELEPGVTYHFRVVATNQWGTTTSDDTTFSFFPQDCPNAHVRQQTASNYLPDCRAYELVSPGSAGAVTFFPSSISTDLGEGFGFQGDPLYAVPPQNSGFATNPPRFSYFGGLGAISGLNPTNSLLDMYVATRTSQGWVTTHPGLRGNEALTSARPQCDLSLSKCLDHITRGTAAFEETSENAPFLWDVSGESLGRLPTNMGLVPGAEKFHGDQLASADFTHFAFSSRDLPFAPGGVNTAPPGSAYDNDIAEQTVSIISKLPSGEPLPQDPVNSEADDEYIFIPAVSTDGSHILMSTATTPVCTLINHDQCPPPGPVELYMRVDDSVSYEVSRGDAVMLVGMVNDGSKVLFTTKTPLTPDDHDASTDLFLWSEVGDKLTRVSQGNAQGDSDECSATWTDGCGIQALKPERKELDDLIAPDNGDVYFYSPELLDGSVPGIPNQRNLYVYRNGDVQFVATFDPGTQTVRSQISPDGKHFAFLTPSKLTGYDNQGFREMYTYDVQSRTTKCISCVVDGDPPTSDVAASDGGPFMSTDGRAFFATADGLVPRDTNGLMDTYEFVDGRPQLISSGTGQVDQWAGATFYPPHKTGLEAVSADGKDVYFSTFDTLVPQDRNGSFVKFYDARTGGGIVADPGLSPCAAADECHGPGSSATPDPAVGTVADLGNGSNQRASGKRRKAGKRHGKRRHRHRRHQSHAVGSAR